MKWSPWLSIVCCTALLAFSSGCLITRHTTNVVRKNEKPRAVVFDSAQSKNIFNGKLAEVKSTPNPNFQNPKVVAVPFLLWWSSTDVVSDNGIYNDQVAICDANGDGMVTMDEANIYAAKVDERVAKHNEEKAKIEAQFASHESIAQNPAPSSRENPPPTPNVNVQPVSVQQAANYQQPTYTQQPNAPLPPGSYR
jgi:hypothetical protein